MDLDSWVSIELRFQHFRFVLFQLNFPDCFWYFLVFKGLNSNVHPSNSLPYPTIIRIIMSIQFYDSKITIFCFSHSIIIQKGSLFGHRFAGIFPEHIIPTKQTSSKTLKKFIDKIVFKSWRHLSSFWTSIYFSCVTNCHWQCFQVVQSCKENNNHIWKILFFQSKWI